MTFSVTSTRCSKAGHREFRLCGESPALKQDAEWLIDYLESSVLNGVNYEVGQKIQIGWMINRIEEGDEGLLRIAEPDFKHQPIVFVASVTKTLFHLRIQKDTADSLAMLDQLTLPSVREAASVPEDWTRSSQLQMFRSEPAGTHSGWILDEVHRDLDNKQELKLISLYELAVMRPEFIPFLALPKETKILGVGTNDVEVFLGDKRITFSKTSFLGRYLDRYYSSAQLGAPQTG